ncbi:MAG TPA: tetratricopeptide repeat protein [Gammaproteobacteria bacterium]
MIGKYLPKIRLAVALLCAALAAPVTAAPAAGSLDDKKSILDLDYGFALYNFYLENYLDAARALMVAKELNRLPNQAQDANILLGGIYLQYGLHQDAENLFSNLIDDKAPPQLRDEIWYSIGKLRYQKGLRDDAIRAFEQIRGSLDKRLYHESQLLLSNMLMQKKEYEQAAIILKKLPGGSVDAKFAEYNLGIALFRGGREIEGAEYLAEVGRLESTDTEMLALKDKANLALGYALLGQEETAKARAFFQKVRLKGPSSNKALLGFGWSHAVKKDYETALASWLELRSRKKTDSAVYESLLAVGYALEQLQAFPQAMQSYLEAIQLFKDEVARLDVAIREVKTGRLMNFLVSQALGDERGQLTEEGLLREVPEFRFITGIVSSHRFNEAIRTLRDLRLMRTNLEYWNTALPAYDDMLLLRRQAYEERLPQLMPEQGVYKIAAFKDEKNLYEEDYKRIVQQRDLKAVASEKEAKLLERLDTIKANLRNAGRQMDATEYGNLEYKYNLYRGLIEWDISTTFNERIWKLKKGLRQLDREIKKTEEQQRIINTAKTRAPRGFEGYNRQISAMSKKIKAMQSQIDSVSEQQQQQVQDIIVDELAWLRDRLAEYLDQAQFSLARLQDMASEK